VDIMRDLHMDSLGQKKKLTYTLRGEESFV